MKTGEYNKYRINEASKKFNLSRIADKTMTFKITEDHVIIPGILK